MLKRICIAALATVATAGLGAGVFFSDHATVANLARLAALQLPTSGQTTGDQTACKPAGLGVALEALEVVSRDTGLNRDQILEQLRQGKSIDQVAGAKASQVEQDLLAALSQRLDKAVSKGRITADQKAAMLAREKSRLDSLLSQNLADRIPSAGHLAGCGHGLLGDLIRVTAQQTGLSVDQVYAQLKAGKTIDQIAGGKAAAIKAQVLQDQEAQLSQMLDRLMSHTFSGEHLPGI